MVIGLKDTIWDWMRLYEIENKYWRKNKKYDVSWKVHLYGVVETVKKDCHK